MVVDNTTFARKIILSFASHRFLMSASWEYGAFRCAPTVYIPQKQECCTLAGVRRPRRERRVFEARAVRCLLRFRNVCRAIGPRRLRAGRAENVEQSYPSQHC